ncbi:putative pentatricopeptide repeat-containing protein At3g18840, partial [Fagus crenata]
ANDLNRFSDSSLIDMYSKCGCFKEACRVFNGCGTCCKEHKLEMALDVFWREPKLNDIVSWNTLISGYAQNGYEEESLRLFLCMAESGIGWNEHTFASLEKEVHAWVLKNEISLNPFISSGIVDVYCNHTTIGNGNCYTITSMIVGYASQGNMVETRTLFDSLPEKNSVVWTALFLGYVRSQQCEVVFELLCEFYAKEATLLMLCPGAKAIHAYLLRVGIEMDEKLIIALVDMYSKCGSIAYAEKIFQRVIDRDLVIYNVMITGYAHQGHENEAIQHFEEMVEKGVDDESPFSHFYALSLLGLDKENTTCRGGRETTKVGDDGAQYVHLANVYATEGNWDDMGRIRKKMRRKEVNKFAG